MDGRPTEPTNKAAFSNFSQVVWTLPYLLAVSKTKVKIFVLIALNGR